ncbi:MAG TPA: TrmO family methyltransferase, partial [Tepidiformaceae bacterium]|nr:TrmO family methyltransferase [Tepidiformaceae bacterium]
HIIVTFYMDIAADAPDKPDTLVLASGNTYGILVTRSQLRPNHLGVSAVRLLAVEGATVTVRGLDAIDATPVLDIKPYLPEYDSHPDATIPEG